MTYCAGKEGSKGKGRKEEKKSLLSECALMTKILQESPDKTSSEHLVYFDIKINK